MAGQDTAIDGVKWSVVRVALAVKRHKSSRYFKVKTDVKTPLFLSTCWLQFQRFFHISSTLSEGHVRLKSSSKQHNVISTATAASQVEVTLRVAGDCYH